MQRTLLIQLFAILAVVLLGAGLDVMEVDAAQYAGMSRDMLVNGDVLQLHYRGEDYLDKPPLLFWVTALSFKIFGVHDWSYRLPSILFAFFGLYSTYRFALLHHTREVARTAALMFGCSAAFFIMCNDVRCDTILTGSVITAVWLGCAWLKEGRWWQLIGLAAALASGLLVKGPIGAVAPLLSIGAQLAFTRNWERLRDPRWLVVPLLVALALVPMCIGLYQQHGWHGVRFFFWEQSFGRITGENRWKDDSTVLFFTHEILWQMLPWTPFVLLGIWCALRSVVRGEALPEHASTIGAVAVFAALSFSQFKLPHYLYITLPLFAVVGARAMHTTTGAWWYRVHWFVVALVWVAALAMAWGVFPERRWPFTAFVLAMGIVILVMVRRLGWQRTAFAGSFWMMFAAGVVLNGLFYPGLLRYQANAKAGQWAAAQPWGHHLFYGMQISGSALDYYAGSPVKWLSNVGEARNVIGPGVAIYTDEVHRALLLKAGLEPKDEIRLWNFPAQRLALPFLSPANRHSTLEKRFILRY